MREPANYIEPAPPKPLVQLSVDEVTDWISRLGLDNYTNELKRWGATGSKLLESTTVQIEKELDIKNALHRKKLLYAIESERCDGAGFFGSSKVFIIKIFKTILITDLQ